MFEKLKQKSNWIILGIISILGLIARLNIINKSTFWYDEAFSGILIKQDVGTILKIIYQDRVHPPIYYFLLKLWAAIFGNTDTTLRMFSVVFGMALIIAAFILIKKLLNTKAAVVAAGIFALSPYFILYSLEARSYIMLGFEALIAIYLFVVIYKKKFSTLNELLNFKESKWLIGIFVLMLLTHYLGAVLIATICILLVTKLYPKLERFIWIGLTLSLVLILVRGLLNSGNYRIFPKEGTHTKWLEDAQPLTIGEMLYSFLFGVDSQGIGKQLVFRFSFIKDLSTVFITIIVLSITLSSNLISKGKVKLSAISKLFLLNILITTIVCLFGINIFVPRYVMYLAIIFVVWIASVVSQFNLKTCVLAAIVYIFLLTQVIWINTNRYFSDLSSIEQETIDNRVLVDSPFDYLVLKYYLGDNRNLFFLDSHEWNMKQGPWLFFDKSQIVERRLATDKII